MPLYVLRVPVRYYRRPPCTSARGSWMRRRVGASTGEEGGRPPSRWDQWNRAAVPAPAPLPVYQRQYTGNRYPQADQQFALQNQNYRYQPRDAVVRQQYQGASAKRPFGEPGAQVATPSPRGQPQPMNRGEVQRPAPTPAPASAGRDAAPRGQPAQISCGETHDRARYRRLRKSRRSHHANRAADKCRVHRPAGGPPPAQQAAAPALHPTTAAPPPAPQRATAPPPAPQHAAAPPHEPSRAGGEPQQRPSQGNGRPNQEKDGEKGGQGGGK